MPAAAQRLQPIEPGRPSGIGRFPVHWISANPVIEEVVAKGVWAVIPLEYYVLNQFSAGLRRGDFEAVAAVALAFVLAIFAMSYGIAALSWRSSASYEERVRGWSMALVVTWTTTLTLLASSYLVGWFADWGGDLGHNVCKKLSGCNDYPSMAVPGLMYTFGIYLVYSIGALILVVIGLWTGRQVTRRAGPPATPTEPRRQPIVGFAPNLFFLAVVNAGVMTILHGVTTLS